jgi:hypothetical protein
MNPDEIRSNIEFYNRLLEITTKEPANFTEMVFRKYIELRTTPKVAALINELGHRIPSVRKDRIYISTDVTAILEDPENKNLVDPEVYELVKQMQSSGRLLKRHVLKPMRK